MKTEVVRSFELLIAMTSMCVNQTHVQSICCNMFHCSL